MKKTVSFTIDADVWLAFHMQVEDRNRSSTVNDLLKNFLEINKSTKEEDELIQEIEEIQEKMRILRESLAMRSVELTTIKNEKAKYFKQITDEGLAVKEADIFRRIIDND